MVVAEYTNVLKATKNITYQTITGRWFMLFASLLLMSIAGSVYIFGIYSIDIKTSLGYDQTTLNLLSFFKDVGANVGVATGLINEVAPPWAVLLIGVVMNFFGYFMIWLSVTKKIHKPKIWQMCVYTWIGANSQSFVNTATLVCCVKNFPNSRGSVLGLLKGYIGLSGAIITQIYHALYYSDNNHSLILLLAWLPSAVSILFLPTIRTLKLKNMEQQKETKVFYKFLYISLGLAGFLMILIILQKQFNFSRIEYVADGIGVICLLILPLVVIFREEFKFNKLLKDNSTSQLKVVTEVPNPNLSSHEQEVEVSTITTTTTTTNLEEKNSCLRTIFKPPNRGEDYTILQALFSIDMLILFVAITFGIGGTLTAIDNLGQIGHSLGYPDKSITTVVSLVSIWNYLGRVGAGYASETLLTIYNTPRPYLLTFVMLLSCVGYILIALGIPNSLYFASVIIGFSFGAQWPLMLAIISELFGLKYYSTLFNFGVGASPLGSYIFKVRVAGYLYDKEALKQLEATGHKRQEGKELTCVGVQCYKLAFIIITASTLVGCFVSFILVLRTRKFYKGFVNGKYRAKLETTDKEIEIVKSDDVLSANEDNRCNTSLCATGGVSHTPAARTC